LSRSFHRKDAKDAKKIKWDIKSDINTSDRYSARRYESVVAVKVFDPVFSLRTLRTPQGGIEKNLCGEKA